MLVDQQSPSWQDTPWMYHISLFLFWPHCWGRTWSVCMTQYSLYNIACTLKLLLIVAYPVLYSNKWMHSDTLISYSWLLVFSDCSITKEIRWNFTIQFSGSTSRLSLGLVLTFLCMKQTSKVYSGVTIIYYNAVVQEYSYGKNYMETGCYLILLGQTWVSL